MSPAEVSSPFSWARGAYWSRGPTRLDGRVSMPNTAIMREIARTSNLQTINVGNMLR